MALIYLPIYSFTHSIVADNTQELSVAELLQKEISALKNASKSSSGFVKFAYIIYIIHC